MIGNDYLFSNIGIDSMGFNAPRYYVNLEELARARNVDPKKYTTGLMLKEMRLPEVDEDIVSIGLKAGYHALLRGNIDPKEIDAIFVGTETITYAVKSVSNIFAELLNVSPNCLTQDIYNACAGGTLAVLNAIALIAKGVINKALVISVDISSYPLESPSEPTQGSGAVALVLSKNPRVATFGEKFGKVSGNINDFWRPANEKNAQVFGKYSLDSYLKLQLEAYDDLIGKMGDIYADYYAFHAPFSKMPLKVIQQIIEKRWSSNLNNLLKINTNHIKSSIFQKFDSFIKDISVLPEYVYLNLKEKGFSSDKLEKLSNWVVSSVKERILPHLSVPMHFGNMYCASVWAQVIYILENFAHENDTVYFGSYGSGATCISGLLKVKYGFKDITKKGPKINDFIKHNKERKSVEEYELIKKGSIKPDFIIAKVEEHELNDHRGFYLRFCDEGCIIPNVKGLNYCPKGHKGFHERFFPLYAKLISEPIYANSFDYSFLNQGLVRVANNVSKNNILEYEIRRIEMEDEASSQRGYLNWAPMYIKTNHIVD
ncbi:MAG: hydroxymethylglutaryl-CoA synthase family protein [Candidatus Lokiarchaeota archaeon]|nr:hydroxymethylglutaryl-CoA synthase family protein [Candidatus Lokiarchaeota archaeon]